MPLAPGTRLGPYEILSTLGGGGQGEVYRARDSRLGRDVAVKIVAADRGAAIASAARFEREWHVVASLSHSNIVALYDVGEQDGVSYAVMELLEGESLDRLIAREPVPWRHALEIGIGVATGLAAAHEKGIVHRDLKPANVFITRDGGIKVLDFGLARSAAPEDGSATTTAALDTSPGTVMGTVGYMAPEQVKGLVADQRSDIFAFGCILYELLTSTRAFKGQTAAETSAAILRDEPREITDSGRRIPIGIEPIVRRCLEKRPDQRFQSARDLAFALKARLDLSNANTMEGGEPPARPSRRTALVAAGVAAVIVTLALAAWQRGWLSAAFGPARIQSLAVLPLLNRSGPEQDYLADGVVEQLITDLGKLEGVRVISRTSSMAYKASPKPLPQIAKELHVDAVVEGSFRKDGSRVTMNVELLDAKTEKPLWSDSFDRDAGDVLVLQNEIAEQIARRIAPELDPEQTSRLRSAKRIDPAAFDAYVHGRYYFNKRTQADFDKAIAAFNQAIDILPTYAAAYAGLADTYGLIGYQNYLPPNEAFPKARAAATRAIELDANSAAAYASLGYVNLYHDWDFASAETNFKHAIALDNQLVSAHHYYSILLTALLRSEEARSEIQKARNLDPLSTNVASDMGFELYYERKYPEAVSALQEAIAASPQAPAAHVWLARTYQAQQRYDDAVKEFMAAGTGFLQWPPALAGLGHLHGVRGHRADALKVIDQLDAQRSQHYVTAYCWALVYLGMKDVPNMRLWLARAIDERSNWPVWLLKDPRWDPVRGDAEFERLVDRVGFPADARRRAAGGAAE
jgi:TolB-like protein/Flp pilus assembly protein TadD